jgi:hypothetical protein
LLNPAGFGSICRHSLPGISMTTYTKNPKVIERVIRGEHIIVPLAGSEEALDSLYVLNRTAGLIWQHAAAGRSVEEIVSAVRETFDVEEGTARQDVNRILDELVSVGVLIQAVGTP